MKIVLQSKIGRSTYSYTNGIWQHINCKYRSSHYTTGKYLVWIISRYLYSPAYSSYEDYSGTLKVNGYVSSYEIALKIKGTVFRIDNLQFNVSSQPGIAYTSACITEELRYFDIPQADYDSKWSTDTWGPSLQLTICPAIRLGEFYLCLEGGYRLAWNEVIEGKIESSTGNSKRFEVMDIAQDGAIFLISLEKEL